MSAAAPPAQPRPDRSGPQPAGYDRWPFQIAVPSSRQAAPKKISLWETFKLSWSKGKTLDSIVLDSQRLPDDSLRRNFIVRRMGEMGYVFDEHAAGVGAERSPANYSVSSTGPSRTEA